MKEIFEKLAEVKKNCEIQKYYTVLGTISYIFDYGLDYDEFNELIELHKNGNSETKEVIGDLLEDINYHSVCRALDEGNYEKAKKAYLG